MNKHYRNSTDQEAVRVGRIAGNEPKWPFAGMAVGEAITVEGRENFDKATSSYKYAARRYSMKFERKTLDDLLVIKRVK